MSPQEPRDQETANPCADCGHDADDHCVYRGTGWTCLHDDGCSCDDWKPVSRG